MENFVTFYVGCSKFANLGNGELKEHISTMDFIKDYLKNPRNGSTKVDNSRTNWYYFDGSETVEINKFKAVMLNHIEDILKYEYIPSWIMVENSWELLNEVFNEEQSALLNHTSINNFYTVTSTPKMFENCLKAKEINKRQCNLFTTEDIPVYTEWLNTVLYYNSFSDINTKYSDIFRRIFKFYGKECIWDFVHSLKLSGGVDEISAGVLANMIDVFDDSFKPDNESDEVKALLISTFTRGAELINEFIRNKDEEYLNTEIKKLMADAANKYAELTASGGTQQQYKSSPESNTDSEIEVPQLDYDSEFNSAPKYDDLEAYTAFIKQQNRQIVEDYARKKEMEMQKENTIETTATVDANGKVLYVAKDDNTFPSYLLNKIFCNKNIMNILKEKFNNTSFHVLLVYSNSIDDYKVFCFNNNIELLFHYIGSKSVIQLSKEIF